MKKLTLKSFLLIGIAIVAFSSCTTINKSMKGTDPIVKFVKADFTFSDQVSSEATCTKIVGIDWSRLFMKKTANVEGGAGAISIASIPVIGNVIADKTANYALYDLMQNNVGYDVVLYPQYETKVVKPIIGIGFLTTITTVKVTARLGKLTK
jgi:hypothetical protein